MSSQQAGAEKAQPPVKLKQRRLQGACDICRQKKVRCDSANALPGQRCTNCVAFGSECTHFHMIKRMGYDFGSMGNTVPAPVVKSLDWTEAKDKMKPLIDEILSSTYQVPTSVALLRESMASLAQYARVLEEALSASSSSNRNSRRASPFEGSSYASHAERSLERSQPEEATGSLVLEDISSPSESLRRSLILDTDEGHFYGPTNTTVIVRAALDSSQESSESTEKSVVRHKRPEFWTSRPWEIAPEPTYAPYDFPDPVLLDQLVDIYFTDVNTFFPLLHRPTIECGLSVGLHYVDPIFGGIILGICAVGGQYCRDTRVFLERSGPNCGQSGGYKWYRQIHLPEEVLINRGHSLHGLQLYVLCILYLQASSKPEKCWYLIGTALRIAQGFGYNREPSQTVPQVERELRKRLFYCLVLSEAVGSAIVGRPRSLTAQSYDLSPLIECDDDYWGATDPEQQFKQPEGKPSTVTFFVQRLKIWEIFGEAEEAFYSVRKRSPPSGMTQDEWNEVQLSRLDSALQSWMDNLPDHLRWDPNQPNYTWMNQSALLHSQFYWVQILIHRPFIGSKDSDKPKGNSLSVCTEAARSCIRIMDWQVKHSKGMIQNSNVGVFMSGVILLLNMWRNRKAGISDDQDDMNNVFKCIDVLKTYEPTWQSAGRFRDVLTGLAMMNQKGPHDRTPSVSRDPETSSSGCPGQGTLYAAEPFQMAPGDTYAGPSPSSAQLSSSGSQLFAQDFAPDHNVPLHRPPPHQQFLSDYLAGELDFPGITQGWPSAQGRVSRVGHGTQGSGPSASSDNAYRSAMETMLLGPPGAYQGSQLSTDEWARIPIGFDWSELGTYLSSNLESANTLPSTQGHPNTYFDSNSMGTFNGFF